MKIYISRLVMLAIAAFTMLAVTAKPKDRVVVAYVCSWTDLRLPDPTLMTHINYAFGHVNKAFNGVDIQNPPFLEKVVALKKQNPNLKINLSIGGWTSGNFSEMAATQANRTAFARDCRRIVDKYGLDGIDIDWEYPTSSESGISSSPDDTKNFTLLMRDLRKALGSKKLLTIATIQDGLYIDFRACVKYLNFVNIMGYDQSNPPMHHTTIHRSPLSGHISLEEGIDAHIKNGVPREKLTLGMPLYGRGDHSNKILDKFMKTGFTDGRYVERWDSIGEVPYLADKTGKLVWGFDNPQSWAAKCQYIIDRGLLGGMYWETTEDNAQRDGQVTIYESLLKNNKGTIPLKHVLVLTGGKSVAVVRQIIEQLKQLGEKCHFDVTELADDAAYTPEYFDRFHLIYQLDANLSKWGNQARKEFETYVDASHGAFFAVTDATVKGWDWYNAFSQDLRVCPLNEKYWSNTTKMGRNLFCVGNDAKAEEVIPLLMK